MKLRTAIELAVDEWMTNDDIKQGDVPVSIDRLLESFKAYLQGRLPVTKAIFGKCLTKRFFKKQNIVTWEQQYYVNKEAI